MKPQKGKIYNIQHTPNKEAGDRDYYYWGSGECISNFSHGGLYEFRLTNGHTGMFSEDDIISEYTCIESKNIEI